MSNTTIIAVTNSYNDTVTMLPPSAVIENIGNVIIHNNPRLEFDGANISKNFDHHIDFRITKNKLHQELVSESYNHYPRLKRRTQYLNVFQFNKGRPLEDQITIPHYYMATLREGEHVNITNFGIPDCDKVVIKEQLGARGSNQVVVPTNMLTTLLKHAKDKTLGEVREMFPDLIYTDNSNWEMKFFDDPNDLFISELITNVKSEYRLLVGGEKIYGRERTIKAGPYPQANLEVDKFHSVQEVTYEPIEDMFEAPLVKTIYDFVEYIDLPIGSVDLYSTTDGTWGIFEYSTQFAFHGASPTFIRQLLLDGVKQILSRQSSALKSTDDKGYISEEFSSCTISFEEETVKIHYVNGPNISPSLQKALNIVVVKYNTLIDAINSARVKVDHISKSMMSTGVEQINVCNLPNNLWSYRMEAGNMSLDINYNSPWSTVLSVQRYTLNDFLKLIQTELMPSKWNNINSMLSAVEIAIADIFSIHNEVKTSNYTMADYKDYLLNELVVGYSDLMYNLGYDRIPNPATQYNIVIKDDIEEYVITSEAPDLHIKLNKEGDSPLLIVNSDVMLVDWVNNSVKLKSEASVTEAINKYNIVSNLASWISDLYLMNDLELSNDPLIKRLQKDMASFKLHR